ncbi:MAG: hypothetical protein RIC24_02540 [Hyphomicrobiales bacterium]
MSVLSAPFSTRQLALLIGLMALAIGLVSTPQVSAQSCLSASQTRSAIASGEVVRLSVITAAARSAGFSQVGSAAVCGSPGNYVYSVVASSANGSSARLTFDARSGALLSQR